VFDVFQGSSLFNIVLGMAASLLALSILIQILQEFYKFLFKSKSAAYKKVLYNLIGSQAAFLWKAPETADYRVRGPWDIFRRKPGGILQPLAKEQLAKALTRAAPYWVTRTLEQIQQEKAGSSGAAESTTWKAFLIRLGQAEKGTTGFGTAREIAILLKEFGHKWEKEDSRIGEISLSKTMDMAKLEQALRHRFLPQVEKAIRDFDLIDRNLEYTYKRRNMRQTFVLGLLVALVMSYPAQDIYQRAAALTNEETVALTEQVLDVYESRQAIDSSEAGNSASAERDIKQLNALLDLLNGRLGITGTETTQKVVAVSDSTDAPVDPASVTEETGPADWGTVEIPLLKKEFWKKKPLGWLSYILGCLATAVLLSFGAPFWNDIAKSVLNYKKSMARRPTPATADTEERAS